MKVSDLKQASYNPRNISNDRLDMLELSMDEFGDIGIIVFNIRTGRLVGGNQRSKVLNPDWEIIKEPHKDKVGTVALGYIETPKGRFQYREVDWPEKKELAANLAANKHGGMFDIPKLKDILVDLDDGDFNLELTGFIGDELKELIDWDAGDLGDAMKALPDGEKEPFQQMTFTVHESQVSIIEAAIKESIVSGQFEGQENQNKNGNALFEICGKYITNG